MGKGHKEDEKQRPTNRTYMENLLVEDKERKKREREREEEAETETNKAASLERE